MSAGSFTDPDADDSWTATVDYGDLSGVQGLTPTGMTFESSGNFTDPGTDEWAATVDYGDGTVQDLTLDNKTFDL